jgi:aryl sulfotransferase
MQVSDSENIAWPKKQGELYHNHFDSATWNDFPFRDDDIIISTYAKSGTTWLQQIVAQLIFNGETHHNVAEMSPWVDFHLPPPEVKLPEIEAQTHRRFLKTHLPVDALNFSSKAKYLYIARDGRDVVWSYYHHHKNMTDEFTAAMNGAAGPSVEQIEKVSLEVDAYFRRWLERDGYPLWQFWQHISSWWEIRKLPNVKILHFGAMKNDMPGQIREIAEFLEIEIDENQWDAILEHCSFDYMRNNSEKSVPLGGAPWKGGAKTFINKGTNGRWHDVLTEEDNQKYEATSLQNLGPECARWLATGELPG